MLPTSLGLLIYSLYYATFKEPINGSFLNNGVGGKTTKIVSFAVNMRSVLAFMDVVCGFGAMNDWLSVMNFRSWKQTFLQENQIKYSSRNHGTIGCYCKSDIF